MKALIAISFLLVGFQAQAVGFRYHSGDLESCPKELELQIGNKFVSISMTSQDSILESEEEGTVTSPGTKRLEQLSVGQTIDDAWKIVTELTSKGFMTERSQHTQQAQIFSVSRSYEISGAELRFTTVTTAWGDDQSDIKTCILQK